MNLPRSTNKYEGGVNTFLDKVFEKASQGNEIWCPCKKCFNHYWHYRSVVENHLIAFGFVGGYTKWSFHGEGWSSNMSHQNIDDERSNMYDDIDGLLHDTFRN